MLCSCLRRVQHFCPTCSWRPQRQEVRAQLLFRPSGKWQQLRRHRVAKYQASVTAGALGTFTSCTDRQDTLPHPSKSATRYGARGRGQEQAQLHTGAAWCRECYCSQPGCLSTAREEQKTAVARAAGRCA
ncbi:hypothetical protein HaLaN_10707 [Haematococcus lacustris]|uniref:Uncharacterized protein n=1 Tax=Haematococcus lacustris TaxID=44745 RepID=A0A699Z5Q7_HAELA|nr:hypothetical protein HaLaN_10707 [Haematococcus lacustris]